MIESGAHRDTKTETVTEEVEVPEVTLTVTLEADVESVEAAAEAYRLNVAQQLNVPLTWIVLDVTGGATRS